MSVCKHIGKDGLCVLHSEIFYKEPCHDGPCKEYESLTNADRIRSMSDNELASWIADIAMCNNCRAKNMDTAKPCKGLYGGCKGNWLDWLKQDAERSD